MKIGEKFSVKGRGDLGIVTLVDLDGDIAYVELKNGVEMDFTSNLLIAPVEIQWSNTITTTWLNMHIGQEVMKNAGKIYNDLHRVAGEPEWSATSNGQKLDFIAKTIRHLSPVKINTGRDLYNTLNNGLLSERSLIECITLQMKNSYVN